MTEAQENFKRVGWVVCVQLLKSLEDLSKDEDGCESLEEFKFYNEGLGAAYKLIADYQDSLTHGQT